MTEHLIRFRGGWESSRIGGGPEESARLILPIAWPRGETGTIRLTRRFGRPPLDPRTESARLEFRAVSGLSSARLNDDDLGFPESGADHWSKPLDGLLRARNSLTLEVDLRKVEAADDSEGWGWIALVIVPNPSDIDPNGRAGGVASSTEMP